MQLTALEGPEPDADKRLHVACLLHPGAVTTVVPWVRRLARQDDWTCLMAPVSRPSKVFFIF